MNYLKLFIVLFFVLINTSFQGNCQSTSPDAKINKAPKWNDLRINSYKGRLEIIKEAQKSAILKLIACSPTRVGLMLGPNGTKPRPSKDGPSGLYFAPAKNTDEMFRFGTFIWQFVYMDDGRDGFCIETLLRVKYSQILKDLDYARLEKKSTYSSKERISEHSNRVYGKDEHERFEFTIEIFPPLFEDEAYSIPGFGWAESPVEAVEFIILHELGHAEIYAQKAKIEFLKNLTGRLFSRKDTDEEEWADSFAATILSCFSQR